MSKQTHIFATRDDLEHGLRLIEARRALKYALCGTYDAPAFETYYSLLEIERLGRNFTGSHVTGDCYLVVDQAKEIRLTAVPQRSGGIRYALDQRLNPTSIAFWPGGMYQDQFLICGHIGTASDDPESVKFYREFARAITRKFEKIKSYYVGPEAARLLDRGTRLVTITVMTPTEYDLAR